MSTRSLVPFARDLELPLDVVTQKLAFIARSGAGKSYAACVLVEGLLDAGAQVVIVDPVGIWFGLRLAADGRKSEFQIPVLGGEHGDMPLEATAGAVIAGFVAERRTSCVLDVSDFTGGEQRRFVKDFAIALHRAKKASRSPVLVVWEEAQDFVPERVGKDEAPMVGAMQKLIKQGRNFGIGTCLISQRPQAVSKDVLNQTELLVALQTTGPHERKAIEGWIVHQGLEKDVLRELPSLAIGSAFVWSPAWLKIFQRVRIGKKRTFDTGKTPEVGGKAVEPRALEPVEFDALRGAMAATIEKAKAEDPKLLQAEVRKLRTELAAARAERPAPERVEVPALKPDELRRIELLVDSARESAELVTRTLDGACERVAKDLKAAAGELGRVLSPLTAPPRTAAPLRAPAVPRAARQSVHSPDRGRPGASAVASPDAGVKLGRCERALLSVLASREASTAAQLSILSGYSSTSSGFANALGSLRSAGLAEGGREAVRITDAGREAIGPVEPLPSGAELVDHWKARLGKCEAALLDALVAAGPGGVKSKDDLGEASGYSVTSSGFANALGKLRTLELAEGYADIRASQSLF